jgi:hypothetical protein
MVIKPIIYVASPYSHPDMIVRDYRFEKVATYAAELNARGWLAFSPIAYGHTMVQHHTMPLDWEFWQTFCISFLSKCNEVHVLMLSGWEQSNGVREEVKWAEENGLTITYIHCDYRKD